MKHCFCYDIDENGDDFQPWPLTWKFSPCLRGILLDTRVSSHISFVFIRRLLMFQKLNSCLHVHKSTYGKNSLKSQFPRVLTDKTYFLSRKAQHACLLHFKEITEIISQKMRIRDRQRGPIMSSTFLWRAQPTRNKIPSAETMPGTACCFQ